jgi:hypothetical protein
MADCNDLFQRFLDEIQIIKTVRDNLRKSRDGIRTTLENYFTKEIQLPKPQFYQQGSFALKTMVKVLNPLDEYDVDDGVYLQELSEDDIKNIEKASAFRTTVLNAVREQTQKPPQRLRSCIRVQYAETSYRYHIDLPVYTEVGGKIYLARDDGWLESDAKAFNKWYYDKLEQNEQMRRCIKYLKAWKDFNSYEIKGIHLTVLIGLKHVSVTDRDDKSLVETIGKIISYLEQKKAIWNPVDQKENMIEDWSEEKMGKIIAAFKEFSSEAGGALDEQDKNKASKKWRVLFGDRFRIEDNDNRGKVVNGPKHREVVVATIPWGEC